MTPDTPEKRTPIVVLEVLPGGWIARCAGLRVYVDNNLRGTHAGNPQVGDVVGYIGDVGLEFERTVILTDESRVSIGRGAFYDDPTQVSLSHFKEVHAEVPREKPYLAMNREPWLKRKKGR